MLPADRLRLQHMLDAAKEAVEFLQGQPRHAFVHNRQLVLALVRCIEVIGEAASQVTKACQDSLPEIPWAQIVAMRHRLIHAYFDVDVDRVWDTVQDDLPPLITQLEAILSEHA